jgi:hypothetical protein
MHPNSSRVYQDIPGYGLDITRMHQAWNVGNGVSIERITKAPGDFRGFTASCSVGYNAPERWQRFVHRENRKLTGGFR